MFIDDDIIEITLYCKKTGRSTMRVETSLKDVPEEEQAEFETHVFRTKPLGWKQHNDVQRSATVDRGGMGAELDWVKYKEEKLIKILVGWDAKNDEEEDVPLTKENIFRLQPVIAETLLNEFDHITLVGEEDRKN